MSENVHSQEQRDNDAGASQALWQSFTKRLEDGAQRDLRDVQLRLIALTRTGLVTLNDLEYLLARVASAIDGLRLMVNEHSATAVWLSEWLHDNPLQGLVAIQLRLAALTRTRPPTIDDVAAIAAQLEGVADNLRQIVPTYPDPSTAGFPLFGRFLALCKSFATETGIACRMDVRPEHLRFDATVSGVLYRSVRELLANVRKHAQASTVTLSSGLFDGGWIFLSVRDDGVGFRPRHEAEETGFGLRSIDRRLSELEGFVEIDGDAGTCATIVLPHRLLAATASEAT